VGSEMCIRDRKDCCKNECHIRSSAKVLAKAKKYIKKTKKIGAS
jgi:hypothetical protein